MQNVGRTKQRRLYTAATTNGRQIDKVLGDVPYSSRSEDLNRLRKQLIVAKRQLEVAIGELNKALKQLNSDG
jgi:hypothetical protein